MAERDTNQNPEHYTFEAVAASLKIPRENWEHPKVRQFIELVLSAQNLQATLTIAETRASARWMKSADATPEEKAAHMDAMVLEPSLADRYTSGDMMLRALLDIMCDGFNGRKANPNYIRSKLTNAIRRYGLEVINTRPTVSVTGAGTAKLPGANPELSAPLDIH